MIFDFCHVWEIGVVAFVFYIFHPCHNLTSFGFSLPVSLSCVFNPGSFTSFLRATETLLSQKSQLRPEHVQTFHFIAQFSLLNIIVLNSGQSSSHQRPLFYYTLSLIYYSILRKQPQVRMFHRSPLHLGICKFIY